MKVDDSAKYCYDFPEASINDIIYEEKRRLHRCLGFLSDTIGVKSANDRKYRAATTMNPLLCYNEKICIPSLFARFPQEPVR